ncbi:hypothetical protein [Pedobacter sp. MW01-1-1]|uniref:hypothetical protein n=1 Tax=Pedobacter sp. MW01-1-1 TaxID=3383027 RepID=UPI003FEF0EF6
MTPSQNLSELSNEQLLAKHKSIKTEKVMDAGLIGFTVGIFGYALYTSGFGWFTFFPLIITYFFVQSTKNKKLLEAEVIKELNSRGLSV